MAIKEKRKSHQHPISKRPWKRSFCYHLLVPQDKEKEIVTLWNQVITVFSFPWSHGAEGLLLASLRGAVGMLKEKMSQLLALRAPRVRTKKFPIKFSFISSFLRSPTKQERKKWRKKENLMKDRNFLSPSWDFLFIGNQSIFFLDSLSSSTDVGNEILLRRGYASLKAVSNPKMVSSSFWTNG